MDFDTTFNFHCDSNGRDPDKYSPTLKKYHQILWSKNLPTGPLFDLKEGGTYLQYKSELGEFSLGSDSITHSYRNQQKKQQIVESIPYEVDELFHTGSVIGAFIVFPNNRIEMQQTINQRRGCESKIDDRFDLTLECIRLFYLNKISPLYKTLMIYKDFFDLFINFEGYVEFFLLQDLIDETGEIKFYLPFDDFKTNPGFSSVEEYLIYKDKVTEFVTLRSKRMEEYVQKVYG